MQLIPSNAWGHPAEPATATGGARRWSLHAVAGAVVLASGLTASAAWAMALGRVSVQSQLGQPLRAEIDVPNISTEEAASLQVGVGSPETFRAAGMEFNPMLAEVRFILERRPNGRTVLRLTSDRVVTEPFLDMVVDVNWSNGHLVRGYTMLFDPPSLKNATPAPVLPMAAPSTPPAPAQASSPAIPPSAPAPSPTPAPRQEVKAPARSEAAEPASQVKVRAGDTAGRIAQAHKPANATLEQMLVGLLRANPNAFIGSNVNRMKAGMVLDMPTEAAVNEVSAAEARRLISVQSQDFNDYRRRLAGAAPQQGTESPGRSASGTVQAEISDQQAAAPAPDKLTLSKGSVKSADSTEAQLAKERQQADTTARQGELKRNLEELKQLNAETAPAPAPAPAAEPEPVAASTPGPAVESPSAVPPAPVPAPAEPAAPTLPKEPPAPPASQASGTDIGAIASEFIDHPMALPAAGGVAALLALLLGLRLYKRRQADVPELDADESLLEAAGGQSIDTDEAQGPVSSMMYSPSQLDAGGDVDPIAEADVYLAYGRDKQAEEILLEALRLHPERINVRLKLLEIYAQRRDTTAFAATATEVFQLTEGQGNEWEQARALGHSLDPANPLYQPNTQAAPSVPAMDVELDLPPLAPATPEPAMAPTSAFPDIDLELPDEPVEPTTETSVPTAEAANSGLDFDLDLTAVEPAPAPAVTEPPAPANDGLDLDFDLDLSASDTPVEPPPSALPAEIEGLSLDLDAETPPPDAEAVAEPDFDMLANLEVDEGGNSGDPLETKLSLAREFEAIGDTEGARSLAEEVVAEATGELQARAQAFLSQLP